MRKRKNKRLKLRIKVLPAAAILSAEEEDPESPEPVGYQWEKNPETGEQEAVSVYEKDN